MKINKEEKEKLLKNKYIKKITNHQIIYTKELKIILWNNYQKGIKGLESFKKLNIDIDIVGKDNPRRLIYRIIREIKEKYNNNVEEWKKDLEYKEERGRKKKVLSKNWEKEIEKLSPEEQNKWLKAKIAIMEKESVLFPFLRKETKLKWKRIRLKRYSFKIIEILNKEGYDLDKLLIINNLSKSGYYKYLRNKLIRENRESYETDLILNIYHKNKGKYGYRRISMEINNGYSYAISANRVLYLMRINKLKSIIRKKRYNKAYQNIAKKTKENLNNIYPNLLNRKFNKKSPYSFFSTDISYFYYFDKNNIERVLYLSVIKDISSRKVLAWNISKSLKMDLVFQTLTNLFNYFNTKKISLKNILIHSDQGVHYTSPLYSNLLKSKGIIQSMSRKGNSIDNAPIESFFGHMKDFVPERGLKEKELIDSITKYMNEYNYKYQWGLNKMSPNQYEKYLLNNS